MASNLYKAFKADNNLEKEGVIVQYGDNSSKEPMSFRIARAGGSNVRYSKVLDHKIKPYRRMIQHGNMPEEVAMQAIREAFAETILLGWENIEDEDGNPLEFSQENALMLFKDLPDLFLDLKEQAESASLFRASALDDEAKN